MPVSPTPSLEAASGRQIARGAAWLMLFKMLDKGVGLVSTLVLARLLMPADFGLVALAMAVVAFTQLMSAFGFDSALIQRQDATRAHYDTAWTFNVVFGLAVMLLLCLLAQPVARFYADERLFAVMIVLGVASFFAGFENIGTVAFRKELDFRSEFRFLAAKRLLSFVVTIGLAIALRSYWALVIGTVTGRLASVWVSYRLHPFRPRLTLAARSDLMHFSKWIFLSSLIGFFTGRSTDFILGRTVGTHGLGIFNVAWEIATMPSTELVAPLNRAVFPAYARLAAHPHALRERFLDVFGVVCLLGIPVSAGLFAAAEPAVRVALGPQWLESVSLIRLFALCGLIGALQSNLYLVLVATGRPQANTVVSGVLMLLSLPLTVWASLQHGVLGAAYAMQVTAVIGLAVITIVFVRLTGIDAGALAARCWRPALASTVMVATMLGVDGTSAFAASSLAGHAGRLIALCIVGATVYVAVLLVAWRLAGAPKGPETLSFSTLRAFAEGWRVPRRDSA